MTRKTRTSNNNATKTVDNVMHVRTLFEIYENLSVRNVANTLGISYHMLLKASKAAKVGEVYDPAAINYEAISAIEKYDSAGVMRAFAEYLLNRKN